jgi:hypothetical protein
MGLVQVRLDEMTNEARVLDELQAWFTSCRPALVDGGYQVDFTESPDRGKPSVSITIASARRISQLTLWSTGEAQLSMGDADSGTVSEEHREITSKIGLQNATETLVAWVAQARY